MTLVKLGSQGRIGMTMRKTGVEKRWNGYGW